MSTGRRGGQPQTPSDSGDRPPDGSGRPGDERPVQHPDRLVHALKRKYPGLAAVCGRYPLKAIRLFCLECMGGSPAEVARCGSLDCPLHPFRFGCRPGTRRSRCEP